MGCVSSRQSLPGGTTSATQTSGVGVEVSPPLRPTRRKRSQLLPDSLNFTDTDNRAKRQAPPNDTTNVQTLARNLTSQFPEDIHKIRAIFCWLAANIRYDTNHSAGTRKSQDAESVLRSRTAVCQGYSELCLALCTAASIPCLVVQGFAKGVNHEPEMEYAEKTEINHAWNLVHIQGEWRPLECTWGAGWLEKGGHFKQEFTDHWFLPDPEDFLPTHFPYMDRDLVGSRRYQLVSRPIDLQQFTAMVKPESPALRISLRFLTHKHTTIDVRDDVTIKVKVKPDRSPLESVTAYMTTPHSHDTRQDRSGVVTSLKDDGTCCVYVRPPGAATNHLTIMGRTKEQAQGTVYQLVTYIIRCSRRQPVQHPFPDKAGMWGRLEPMATQCALGETKNTPFQWVARNGQVTVTLPLVKPGVTVQPELFHALDMKKNLALENYTLTENTGHGVTIAARLPHAGYYLLRIFASHPDLVTNLPHVADLLLYCRSHVTNIHPFPQAYTFAYKHHVRLLQPKWRMVPPGVKTLYRVHAPSLATVKVAGIEMTLKKRVWEAEVIPKPGDTEVTLFGTTEKGASTLNGLYQFSVSAE